MKAATPWRRALIKAAAFALFSLGTGSTLAVPLQDLFGGDSIQINDKVFSDWELIFNDPLNPVDFSTIDVTGDGSSVFDPGPILIFASTVLSVVDDDFIDFEFEFTVSTTSGTALIKDNGLELTDTSFSGDGFINIAETLFDANDDPLSDLLVEVETGVSSLADSADFAPQSSVLVNSTVLVDGAGAGSASLGGWQMSFSQLEVQAPAPATLALLGVALLMVGVRRRRELRTGQVEQA